MRWSPYALALASACFARAMSAEVPAMQEYAIKAQILVALLSYIQFPQEEVEAGQPFQIAVLGHSPFGPHLEDYAKSRTVSKRPIRIIHVNTVTQAAGCQALFICRSEFPQREAILGWVRSRKILTLSDDERLAQGGVMVNLLMDGSFVRLSVNPEAASAESIGMGSQLLRHAKIIKSSQNPPIH